MSTNRVLQQLARWRQDLINLSRSNRLVYFRHTKTSTIEIKNPVLGSLLSRLSSTRGIAFWEAPPELHLDMDDDLATRRDHAIREGAKSQKPGPQRSRLRRLRNAPADQLVCDVTDPDALSKVLRCLDRRATQEFMDKGLWILYLGIGILKWVEQPPNTSAEPEDISSPVLLLPVRLHKESVQSPFELYRVDEDAVLNPALAFKLQHDFDVSLPAFDDADEDDLDAYLDKIRKEIEDHNSWEVEDRVVLSLFSFHKEAMYRDLENNEVAVASSPLVQALAVGHRASSSLTFDPVREDELDEAHPPESVISILDCDASQRQCLAAAARGHSFIMEGPPGTGKSQTIANTIADALGHGRTVLFVSEKAAALEVVRNRLDQAGLSEFILELHSHKATRKQVAQTLGRSLTTRVSSGQRMQETDLQQLIARRRELTSYARAMNERREPIGRSLHDVLGELSKLQHLPHAPTSDAIDASLTAETLARIYDAAESLCHAWGPIQRPDDFLWRGVANTSLTQGRKAVLAESLAEAARLLEDLEQWVKRLAEDTGLDWRASVTDAERFEKLILLVAKPEPAPAHWLSVQSLRPVHARCETLSNASIRRDALVNGLVTRCGSNWQALNAADRSRLAHHRATWESSAFRF